MADTFTTVMNDNRLLYHYIRGSHAYGLDLPTSDIDTGGVYIMSPDICYGLPVNQMPQIDDERHDTTWYEIGRYMELLIKSNPTMLESLFVPDRCIKFVHPVFKPILENRDMFVTQECFNGFTSYAISQISKAKGLNKKINNPMTERKTPLDFCWTFNQEQGTMHLEKWLDRRGLKQKYCGLNHMPNMTEMYGVFYDYQEHIRLDYPTADDFADAVLNIQSEDKPLAKMLHFYKSSFPALETREQIVSFYESLVPKGYHGIQREDGTSNDIRLDSILKEDKPICVMHYNKNGYTMHCREYREYQEWVKKRNPQRYLENKEKDFDRKNMAHCVRLLTMGIEIAETGKVNVDRTNIDRDFILSIRQGNATYDELLAYAEKKQAELNEAVKSTKLPLTVNVNDVNDLLIKIRKDFYGN